MKVAPDALAAAVAALTGSADHKQTHQALADAVTAVINDASGPNADALRAWMAGQNEYALSQLAESALGAGPDYDFARYKSTLRRALGLTDNGQTDAAGHAAASKLAAALHGVVDHALERMSLPASATRMTWAASRQAAVGADVTDLPKGHRTLAALRLDRDSVATFVNAGVPTIDNALVRLNAQELRSEDRAVLAARHRDINNIIYTEPCHAIADKLTNLDVPALLRTTTLDATVGNNRPSALLDKLNGSPYDEINTARRLGHLAFCERTVHGSGYVSSPRVNFDELGEPLAFAIKQATQLVVSAVSADQQLQFSVDPEVAKWANFQREPQRVFEESLATIEHALALLLAKRPPPPFETPRAALREVVRSGLVTRIAMAPFGLLAGLTSHNLVPTTACQLDAARSDKPRLTLPPGLSELFDSVAAHNEVKFAEGRLEHTETMRGCPVAGRGPIIAPDGTLRMSEQSGLTVIVEAFAGIVEKILDAREAAAS